LSISSRYFPTLASFLILSILQAHAQSNPKPASKLHTYFIAADELTWDYTPQGRGLIGAPHLEGADEDAAGSGPRTYHKAVFREYTDATFSHQKPRPAEWEHLGILGPLIRAEVGDTIQVFFKNNTKLTCSMHPHGLSYAKDSEGAMYNDGSPQAAKKDDMIPPGGTYTYYWMVPDRAGPGPGDPNSVLWMYHGHFVEPKDINTGLLGPIIITAGGASRPDGTPKGVDREFVTAFAVFDETDSWFFELGPGKARSSLPMRVTDPVFREQNLLYSINGFIEGNLSGLTMKRGERVRWYLMANSNEDDVHTVHWHGQTVLFNHMRTDTVPLGPMGMAVADMVPDKEGTWLFHCHVNDHLMGGMQALFKVLPTSSGPTFQPQKSR
jgi:FtsP/CotA-like multicopper oxidase with cupredoxin domain